jgi:hypothetical protein
MATAQAKLRQLDTCSLRDGKWGKRRGRKNCGMAVKAKYLHSYIRCKEQTKLAVKIHKQNRNNFYIRRQ